ncbi:MAG: hypothetical protein IJZ30_03275 [Alphaproteobacteria bacterium]|nr:hypothetical protein [Alphaproteobacteria bacterium]
MDEKLKKLAIEDFVKQYGKTPKECGYPIIDVYRKQSAFLYGKSLEAIKGYKTCQNILRWLMTWFLFPMVMAFIVFMFGLLQYCNDSKVNPLIVISLSFFAFWIILFIIQYIRVKKADKVSRNNVIWLNY